MERTGITPGRHGLYNAQCARVIGHTRGSYVSKYTHYTRGALFFRCSRGGAGIGVMILFAVVFSAMLLIGELYYIFTVRENVEAELSRAVNTAVDLSMSDAHRQDRLLALDAAVAYDSFYEYLREDMSLSSRLEAYGRGGIMYSLEITELAISQSPPGIRVTTVLTLNPAYIGKLAPAPISFTVRASSVNRRIE